MIRCIFVVNGEFQEELHWDTPEEFQAFREGLARGMEFVPEYNYDVYTRESLMDTSVSARMKVLIEQILRPEG